MAHEHGGVLYLDAADVLRLYADVVECADDEARDYVRTMGGLESAIARPIHWAEYQDADIVLQAAALGHGLAETQVFIDGNKRIAASALIMFLRINGYELTADEDTLYMFMVQLSAGLLPGDFAVALRPHLVELYPDID